MKLSPEQTSSVLRTNARTLPTVSYTQKMTFMLRVIHLLDDVLSD